VRIIRYARKVRHKTSLSILQQLREAYHLRRLNLLEPLEYYETYELFDPRLTWEEKKRFLSRNQFAILDRELNPKAGIGVLNKLVFKIFARHFNLPVARMYGLFDPHWGYLDDGSPLCTVDDLAGLIANPELQSFLFKPISANKAAGIIVCSKQNGRLIILGEGEVTISDLYQRLCGSHHGGHPFVADSWIVEERIRQHPWFDRYAPQFVHNYRLVTFLSAEGAVELVGASIGIGLQGHYKHVAGALGMSAGLSDEGVLTAAVRGGTGGLEYFESHPETGARIAGERPPGFQEAVQTAFRAHSFLPHLRLLGWDIAPTEQGPVIFEGNAYWNWEKLQCSMRRGVIRGALAKELPAIIRSGQRP